MGKYFDERLTDEEGYTLVGEDIYNIYEIFETRDEATHFMSERYNKTIEEINEIWEQESEEFYSSMRYYKENNDVEGLKWFLNGERVADFGINMHKGLVKATMETPHDAAYCLFQSGRVALVQFYQISLKRGKTSLFYFIGL